MEIQPQRGPAENQGGESFAGRRIHLIGIGGSGMRALGEMLLAGQAEVSGSDMAHSAATRRLSENGADVHIGQTPENIPEDCDLIVYSAAIHDANPELAAARERGIEVLKYSQMLGRLMAQRVGLAISGTHGKSTTSAMVSYVLDRAGTEPSFIVGATVEQLGGPSGVGRGRYFVAEACEYDRSFLNLRPLYAAILNIEEDHLDCFEDLDAIIEAFRAFGARMDPAGVLVVNGEDRNVLRAVRDTVCEVETFGMEEGCDWRGANIEMDRGRVRMDVIRQGRVFCHLAVPLPGLHNAYNTLAAVGLLHHAGLEPGQIARHIQRFAGTYRRMTLKGRNGGITVVDDFAHHPTEIQTTLRALRDFYQPRRLVCVFQPHQHSRTRFLLKDFARSFALAEEVLVPDIYFVRDSDREKDYISSEDLVSQIRLHGGVAMYLRSLDEIMVHLQTTLAPGDLLVTMGAGNVWEVADGIVRWIGIDR